MPTIFISHSTRDNDATRVIADAFKSSGFDVWVDFDSIGDGARWVREIQTGIDGCDAVVVVLSKASRQSEWVEKECLYAFGLQKPVFIALIEDVPLPLQLINIQYTDCRDSIPNQITDLITAIQNRLKSDEKLADHIADDASVDPSEDNFFAYVEQLPEGETAMLVAQDLYFWGQQVADVVEFGGRYNPVYHVKVKLGDTLVTVFSVWAYPKTPSMQIPFDYLQSYSPYTRKASRLSALKQLNQLMPDDNLFDAEKADRRPTFPLHILSTAEQLEGFKQIIKEMINQLQAQ